MNRLRTDILCLLLFALSCYAVPQPVEGAQGQSSPKVALALSGGGARGAAHAGVLRVIEQNNIPVHCIVGTSFGALVGGLFSIGYSADDIEYILTGQDWNRMFSDAPERRFMPLIERRNSRYQVDLPFRGWTPQLPTGIRGGQRMTEALDELTTGRMLSAGYDFDKLPIQFRAVATNLLDGSPYIFSRGSMTEALRASMAIPLLFTPHEKDDLLLVDGGLVANLPTTVARDECGADVIIAVDVTSPLRKKDEIGSFLDVIDQSISLQMERNKEESRKLADILIQPRLDDFSNTDYEDFSRIAKRGEEAATLLLDQIKSLTAGAKPREAVRPALPANAIPRVESISFRGLRRIKPDQLIKEVQVNPGEFVDPSAIGEDVNRLFATRLFDTVTYSLEPLGGNRYNLVYTVREAAFKGLGAALRYDNDYNFVVLAEFTARQLFDTRSTAILSTQFGGLENHFAVLRYVPAAAPFFFMEPRAEATRLERLDIRDEQKIDQYTDKREGGRFLIGGTIYRELEIAAGYRAERVRIDGGSDPNRLEGSEVLAGLTLRLNRDSLDSRDFPRSGSALRLQIDKRSKALGSDLEYSKWEADYRRYFSLSRKSTLQINAAAGHTRGSVPFYDQFFIGGYSFSQMASRPFVGLERDELQTRQMAILGATYRRRLFSQSLSFIRRGYVLGIYNGILSSDREEAPYEFDLFHGVGMGIALDTVVGPIHTAVGWSEGGRFNFYFTFGPSF